VVILEPDKALDVDEMAQLCDAAPRTPWRPEDPMQTLHDDTFGRIAGLMHEAIGCTWRRPRSRWSRRAWRRASRSWGWTATTTTCT
jgi:hypothetical protein